MTTAIAVYDSDGCRGRCDANCHDATGKDCDCICGGANHGGGLRAAIENNHKRYGLVGEVELEDGRTLRFPTFEPAEQGALL
jgi:hypothetical protein